MRSHYLLIFLIFWSTALHAQPAGPNNSTNVFDGGGGQISETWTNPNLARTQDNLYASIVTTTKNKRTNYLQAQNYGFNIPAGSSIDGIVVEIDRYGTAVGGSVLDARIRIIDATGNIIAGSDHSTGLTWPTTDASTYQTYGGPTDKWSVTDWTAAKINNSNFGVALQAETSNDNTTFNIFVDHIRITVYYTSGGSQRWAVATGNWNNTGTWAATPGGAPGASVPTAANDVFIGGGFTVTNDINTAACNSLTIGTSEATPNGNLSFNSNARDISVGNGGMVVTANGDVISAFTPRITVTGDLTLNKVLTNQAFEIRLSGAGTQVINGTGTLGILDMQANATNTGSLGITVQLKGNNNALINGSTGYINFSAPSSNLINCTTVGNTIEFSHVLPAADFNIINTSTSYYNLVISGSANKRFGSNITVNNNLTITATGVLNNSNNRDISLYGNWANSNGASGFVPGSGDVFFLGGNAQSIGNAAGQTFYRLVVNKTAGTTVTAINNVAVTNRLTMTEGIFSMGSNALTGAGSTTFDGGELQLGATGQTVPQLTGAYTINAGLITFNGAGAQTIRSSSSTPAISAYANVQFSGSGTKTLSGAIVVNNDLTIGGTADLDASISNFGINLKGNWTSTATFTPRNGTVSLTGTAGQTITKAAGETFYNLTVNNTAATNSVTLGGPASVSNTITLTDGIVVTTSSNLLTLGAAATAASTSDASHVKGPMAKIKNTTTAFAFPVGDGTNYMPVSVTPTSTSSTTYVAEYFVGEQALGSTLGAGVDHISSQDYWSVNRTSGTADAAVTLSWEYSASPEVNVLSELLVAQWDGAQWASRGNAATTGNASAGTVRSNPISSFTTPYFVIASSTTNNPLSINRYFVAATGNWNSAGVWAYSSGGPATAPEPTATKNVIIEAGNVATILDNPAGEATKSMLKLTINGTLNLGDAAGQNIIVNVGAGGMVIGSAGNITGADNGDDIRMSGNITLSNVGTISHTNLEVNFSSQGNTVSGTGSLPYLNVNQNNQIFTGSTTYTTLTVPNSATNNGTITVNGALSGGGTLANGATGTIIWQGTSVAGRVINASTVGNTVQLINNTGGNIDIDVPVSAGTYHNLVLGGANTFTQTANIAINGNLTINAGGVLNNASNNRQLTVNGNWTNNNGAGGFLHGTNVIRFNGSSAQTLFTSSGIETFAQMAINNTSSTGLTFSQGEVHITNDLTLTDGNIYTTSANLLVIQSGATTDPGSAASFVDGPMKKIGNTAFTFPVGTGSTWARLRMETLSNYNATTEFTCQYLRTSYSDVTNKKPDVNNVSTIEHWLLTRVLDPGNDASCRVRLYWESQTASNITDLADLRVGHYYNSGTGNMWHNFGGSVVDNGNGSGEIVSTTTFTSFSPITFASEFGFNPLPVELVAFEAIVENDRIKLFWETASELNNDYFEVQRFIDIEQPESLGRVVGHGTTSNTNRYEFIDNAPVYGKAYYRLKQVDFDGEYQYSRILAVSFDREVSFSIYPNPSDGTNLSITGGIQNGPVRISILNVQGAVVAQYMNDHSPTSRVIDFKDPVSPGLYFVRIEHERGVTIRRWIVR